MKKWTLILCLFLLPAQLLHANEIHLLTLDECIDSTLAHNSRIRLNELDNLEAEEGVRFSSRGLLPTFSTSFYGVLSTDDSIHAFDVRADQPLFMGGELIAKKHKSEALLEQKRYESNLNKSELAFLTSQVFYEIKTLEAEVKFLEEHVVFLNKQALVQSKLAEQDMNIASDVLSQKAEIKAKEVELEDKQSELELHYDYLLQITGLNPEHSYVLADVEENLSAVNAEIHDALVYALDAEIEQAEQDVKIAKSNFFPKAGLVARYRNEQDTFYEKDAFEAGVLVKWNFWDFGQTSSDVKKSKIKHQKRLLNKGIVLQDYKYELKKLTHELQTNHSKVELAKEQLHLEEENFKSANTRKMQGDVSTLAYDQIKLRLSNAKTAVVKAIIDYRVTESKIHHLSGALVKDSVYE